MQDPHIDATFTAEALDRLSPQIGVISR